MQEFPRNALVCWKYIFGFCKNDHCQNGVHDETLREGFLQRNPSTEALYDTEPTSPHPNFSVHCLSCNRCLVKGENVHRIIHNSVWARALESDAVFVGSEVHAHPYKGQAQSVFCVCSRWIGDYFPQYKCQDTGEVVEYKIEIITQFGRDSNYWVGNQDGHEKLSEKPHERKWKSEKRDKEFELIAAYDKANLPIDEEKARQVVGETDPEDVRKQIEVLSLSHNQS